jgi:hypothetical protein
MTNISTFRNWCQAIANGEQQQNAECTSIAPAEFWMLHTKAGEAMVWLMRKNIQAKLAGQGNIRENGFQLRAGGSTFTIMPPSAQGKKGVSDTSREAYASLDKAGQALQVAEAVVKLHAIHPFVSDSLVARETGLPSARVSARRNEIEAMGAILVDGSIYHFKEADKKITCPVTGSTVNGWQLVLPSQLF